MLCKACGNEIDENKKYCKYCGAPVEQQNHSEENSAFITKCQGCGALLKPGSAFCTQCGKPVSKTVSPNVNAPIIADKTKRVEIRLEK